MEMELETSPAAAGTESKDLCATITALAYPSSSSSSNHFFLCWLSLLTDQHQECSSVILDTGDRIHSCQSHFISLSSVAFGLTNK